MYFQKDYVLRMIEMLGELVRRIGEMTREADARGEVNEIAERACGLPIGLLIAADAASLPEMLGEAQRYLAGQLLLIHLEIEARKAPEEDLAPIRAQALSVFATLTEPDYLLPAADAAARLLPEMADQLPLETLVSVAGLLERAGLYAPAEDAHFAALERGGAIQPATEFYARLALLPDAALVQGGLPRAELAEGLEALQQFDSTVG
ncbi:MAG: DUF6483 family protein [Oscillospiraceae bacterium]|jgi:hypothetical protein|nr:DUF6483 family protein [Oscillospiraceae bacterium]